MRRIKVWLSVTLLLFSAGGGLYLWWFQRGTDEARDHLAILVDLKAKQDNWKERWKVKYGEYRKLKAAGDKPPVELLTALKLLRLEWTGLAYRKIALTEAAPHGEEDLSKYMPDWKELGQGEPFVILWGVDRAGLAEGGSQALLAWEPRADETGHRCVLMADGTCKLVDEESFLGMRKANVQ